MAQEGSGTNRQQPVPLQQRIRSLRRRLLLERAAFLLVIVGLLYLLVRQEQAGRAFQITAGEQTIALVGSESTAQRILEEFKRQRVPDVPDKSFFHPNVRVIPVAREGRPLRSEEEAALALGKVSKVFAPGAVIFADDRFVVGLRSKADATRCIADLLKSYGPGKSTIQGQVDIRETNLEASARLPVPDAVRVLKTPAKAKTYKVQHGDTAWKIASAEGVAMETLKRLNPSVNMSALHPGTEIKVSDARPRLTVVTKRRVDRIEPIPYEIEVVPTPQLPKGQRKVVRKGERGEKRIVEELTLANNVETSRHQVSVKTQKQPVVEVVWVGKGAPRSDLRQ